MNIASLVTAIRGLVGIRDSAGNTVDTVDDAGVRRLAIDVKQTGASPNDFLSKVSANDTTGDYLLNKITVADEANTTNILERKEVNDGADEDLKIALDEAKINHDNILNSGGNKHIDWTAPGAGTIDPSNYADNDTVYSHPNHSGDVTSVGDGAQTIANNAVTNAKAADMPANTIKGNDTGGVLDPKDLTPTEVTAMLNLFTASLKGLVPLSGGGTTNFLRADGTWAAPPGGGGGLWTDGGAFTYLTSITDDVSVGSSSAPDANFRMQINNGSGQDGLKIKAGEVLGDIALHLGDQDDSYVILEVEADQGYTTFGKSYAQTLTDNGSVFGVDNQNDVSGASADFNCQLGAFRIGGDLPDTQVSSASSTSTTSTGYVLISGMTVTPGEGTYLVYFSASGRGQSENQQLQVCLYSNGAFVSHTERDYGFDADDPTTEDRRFSVHTQMKITVADGQAIEARYKTDYSTFNMFERSLILHKVKAD